MKKCKSCGGSGEGCEAWKYCFDCKGKGLVPTVADLRHIPDELLAKALRQRGWKVETVRSGEWSTEKSE